MDASSHTPLAARILDRSRDRWGDAAPPMLVGRHPRFAAALERLERLAGSDAPVLLTGETGTGKELFARGLYLLSRRDGRPFLRVNCAQFHDGQLMASELFGHKRGSFTGAVGDHVGLFESAHAGMVFLDEITELSVHAQAMLLRVLSEGEIVPIGETAPRRLDVRVVAATSADLPSLVRTGRFRADLYYRLRGLHLAIPAVRERGEDWALIAAHYLAQLSAARRRAVSLSREAESILAGYDWPGNVREVKGLVDASFHLSEGEWIEPRHFLESLERAARAGQFEKLPLVDAAADLYDLLSSGDGDFWHLVHGPFLERELSRGQVRALIGRGLDRTGGRYKDLLPLFSMPQADYPRFMDFLRHHDLKPLKPPRA